jgi:TP901 family phage tail tape measure protein
MAAPAAVLNVLVTANTSQATTGLAKVNSQLGATSKSANQLSSTMKTMAKGAGLAAAGVAAHQAVGAFMDFDRSMRNVNSIAQLNEREFKKLSKSVLALAGPTAQAPKTLADGLYDLVSSGFDANEAIQVLEKSAIAATAGMTDTATASKVVAASINSYGLAAKDAGHVSDILFRTVDRGVLTFEELAQSLGPVLPAANSLNVSLQQVGAALATLTKQGFPAAEAATAIDAAMRALLKPSVDMKAAFRELGVAGGEELVRKYGSLQAALQALRGTTDGSGAAMNKLFNEIRGARGALGLTGAASKGAAKDLRELGKATGATSRAFREQAKSASVQWQRLKAELEALAVSVGTVLFPVIRRAIIITKGFAEIASTTARGPLARLMQVIMAIGNPITRFIGLVRLAVAGVKILARWFGTLAAAARPIIVAVGDKLSPAFRTLKNVIDAALSPLRRARDLLKDIAGLAGKIPGVLGDIGGAVNPFGKGRPLEDFFGQFAPFMPFTGKLGSKSSSLDALKRISLAMGLSGGTGVGQGYRPGDDGWHGVNRAFDSSGPPAKMMAFARFMAENFGGKLIELIYTPLGFSIKNGQRTPPYAQADHYDHVHVAMAKGGVARKNVRALVGEEGPEIVDLPVGARVHSFSKSKQMVRQMGGLLPGFASGGLVARAAHAAGFRGANLLRAVAEAKGESGWNERAVGDGGASKGLMQIHTGFNPWAASMNLFNPFQNMRAAMRIFRSQGWGAWYADHTPHIGAARAAIAAMGGAKKGAGKGSKFEFKDVHWTAKGKKVGDKTSLPDGPHFFEDGSGWRVKNGRIVAVTRGTSREGARRYLARPGATKSLDIMDARTEGNWQRIQDMNMRADEVITPKERKRAENAYLARAEVLNKQVARHKRRLRKINRALRGRLRPATRRRLLTEKAQKIRDIQSLQGNIRALTGEFQDIVAPFDPVDTGGGDVGGGDGGEANQALIDALEQARAATEAHTQALSELKDQQKRNEDLIRAQGPALTNAVIQMVNGGIGGNAGLGRQFPSSTGLGGLSRA